jgi:hypothetical protein
MRARTSDRHVIMLVGIWGDKKRFILCATILNGISDRESVAVANSLFANVTNSLRPNGHHTPAQKEPSLVLLTFGGNYPSTEVFQREESNDCSVLTHSAGGEAPPDNRDRRWFFIRKDNSFSDEPSDGADRNFLIHLSHEITGCIRLLADCPSVQWVKAPRWTTPLTSVHLVGLLPCPNVGTDPRCRRASQLRSRPSFKEPLI